MGLGTAVIVLRVAREYDGDASCGSRPIEVRFPSCLTLEDITHRRQAAPIEKIRVPTVDMEPGIHAVGKLLSDPGAIFGFGRRIQPPPRIEIARRHPPRFFRCERRE